MVWYAWGGWDAEAWGLGIGGERALVRELGESIDRSMGGWMGALGGCCWLPNV